jgi:hypothetical protein
MTPGLLPRTVAVILGVYSNWDAYTIVDNPAGVEERPDL